MLPKANVAVLVAFPDERARPLASDPNVRLIEGSIVAVTVRTPELVVSAIKVGLIVSKAAHEKANNRVLYIYSYSPKFNFCAADKTSPCEKSSRSASTARIVCGRCRTVLVCCPVGIRGNGPMHYLRVNEALVANNFRAIVRNYADIPPLFALNLEGDMPFGTIALCLDGFELGSNEFTFPFR
jgi:hypothetical protein